MEEKSDNQADNRFSFDRQVNKTRIHDGLWQAHDALCETVRLISKKADEGEKQELLEAAVDAHAAYLKKIIVEANDLSDLGYGTETMSEDIEDEDSF